MCLRYFIFASLLRKVKIWDDIATFNVKKPVVTIGSFDGVHRGHRYVLNQLNELARSVKGESVVFTFFPHPVTVLNPDKELVLLTTIEEKIELFRNAGVQNLVLYAFTKEFSQLSYNDFVKTILIDKLNTHTLLVGYDNAVGKNKEGNFAQLQELSVDYNFSLVKQDEIRFNDENLSSTNIRALLSKGKLLEASKLLGYPYIISGTVVRGQQLGNKLGFPTANVLPSNNKFIPGMGVYAVMVEYSGNSYKGMMNIGLRPTVEDYANKAVIEAHIFDFKENLYGKFIKISIIRKLRNEYKFNSVDALRAQLKKDKLFALETLNKEFGIK